MNWRQSRGRQPTGNAAPDIESDFAAQFRLSSLVPERWHSLRTRWARRFSQIVRARSSSSPAPRICYVDNHAEFVGGAIVPHRDRPVPAPAVQDVAMHLPPAVPVDSRPRCACNRFRHRPRLMPGWLSRKAPEDRAVRKVASPLALSPQGLCRPLHLRHSPVSELSQKPDRSGAEHSVRPPA